MSVIPVSESSQEVIVPGVGALLRVERRSPDGELLDVEYRRATEFTSAVADGNPAPLQGNAPHPGVESSPR
jgi:hypothetical protein